MRKQSLLYEDPSHTVVENIIGGILISALTFPAAAAAPFCKFSAAIWWGAMVSTCTRSCIARVKCLDSVSHFFVSSSFSLL